MISKGSSVAPVFAPQRRQFLHIPDRVVPDVGGADPAIAQPSRPAQRHLRFAAAQDRHRRRRVRLEHQLWHLVVPPAPRHPAALPQRTQRRDHLVQPLAAAAEILSQQLEFLAHPAGADGQRHPAAGDHRCGRHLLGDLDERPGRGDVDGVGEPQPSGGRRHRADHDPRIGPGRLGWPRRHSRRGRVRRRQIAGIDQVIGADDAVVATVVEHAGDRQRVIGLHKRCAGPELHQAPFRTLTSGSSRGMS